MQTKYLLHTVTQSTQATHMHVITLGTHDKVLIRSL